MRFNRLEKILALVKDHIRLQNGIADLSRKVAALSSLPDCRIVILEWDEHHCLPYLALDGLSQIYDRKEEL